MCIVVSVTVITRTKVVVAAVIVFCDEQVALHFLSNIYLSIYLFIYLFSYLFTNLKLTYRLFVYQGIIKEKSIQTGEPYSTTVEM